MADEPSARDGKGKFLPGNRLSPGRPKEYPEFKAACRDHSDAALHVYVEALTATRKIYSADGSYCGEEPDHKLRIMAAQQLHDRGWGKPSQTVDLVVQRELAVIFDKMRSALPLEMYRNVLITLGRDDDSAAAPQLASSDESGIDPDK